MPYRNRIKTLEESYRLVEIQISNIEEVENIDIDKLTKLREAKSKYLSELSFLRRAQYEESQNVDYDDDR